MRHLLRDMRFGLRLLLKNRGFTAAERWQRPC
jgi:hypothetical protein